MIFDNIKPNTPTIVDKSLLDRIDMTNTIINKAKELNADIILSDGINDDSITIEFRKY